MECLSFIAHVFRPLLCSFGIPPRSLDTFPDDILIDILSRLPAECVRDCRKVCRNWRRLTSLQCFAEIRSRRATQVIFIQCDHVFESPAHLLVLDETTRRLTTYMKSDWLVPDIKYHPILVSSFGGLFLFEEFCLGHVFDPCTGEVRSIKFPSPGKVCGLFFLPLASEYKILFRYHAFSHYCLYDSKTMMCTNITSKYSDLHPHYHSPAIVNLAFHWILDVHSAKRYEIDLCSHAILIFKMVTEEFCCMPHPEVNCEDVLHHQRMELFVKDEMLCLCNMRHVFYGEMDIWILETYEDWFWVKRHRLQVGMFPKPDCATSHCFRKYDPVKISIVVVGQDELLISWFTMGLYILNLTLGTAEELKVPCDDGSGKNIFCYFAALTSCIHPSPN